MLHESFKLARRNGARQKDWRRLPSRAHSYGAPVGQLKCFKRQARHEDYVMQVSFFLNRVGTDLSTLLLGYHLPTSGELYIDTKCKETQLYYEALKLLWRVIPITKLGRSKKWLNTWQVSRRPWHTTSCTRPALRDTSRKRAAVWRVNSSTVAVPGPPGSSTVPKR